MREYYIYTDGGIVKAQLVPLDNDDRTAQWYVLGMEYNDVRVMKANSIGDAIGRATSL